MVQVLIAYLLGGFVIAIVIAFVDWKTISEEYHDWKFVLKLIVVVTVAWPTLLAMFMALTVLDIVEWFRNRNRRR